MGKNDFMKPVATGIFQGQRAKANIRKVLPETQVDT